MTLAVDPFEGEGEVRALARAVDWSSTALGPVEEWSGTLRGVVRTSLDSPFPVNLWCGPDLVLIYNDAYRKVLGTKHPAALGRSGREVWAEIWDDVVPLFERIRAGRGAVFQEDAPFIIRRTGDAETNPLDKPNAWFTFSLSPVLNESGDIVAFLNIVAETTDRVLVDRAHEAARAKAERAEARLREVFAHAPSFLAVLRGEDHVYEYVNKAYYQLVGHRDLLGRPVFDALPELRGQGFEKLLEQVLEQGEPFVGREVQFTVSPTPGAPPEERYVDLVYYPITEADGRRSGVVAHGNDVTNHVVDRREAQRARAEAEQANLAKSQFLATMSHEIRTPINAIMGYADLLDAGVAGALNAGQSKYLEGIQAGSRHLLGLVSDILDLAKIEAGEMLVGSEEVLPREAVEGALRIVAPQAAAKGLEVSQVWECDEDTRARGDENRVRQILLNLLSNALKFTEPGGSIVVRCRVEEAAPADSSLPGVGPWVVLDVEDTGQGIPEPRLARIFDPFVQAESGHTRRVGGTGLGLTISRRLARLMAGELTARSEPGSGSTFSLWLSSAVQERVGGVFPATADAEAWPPEPHELPGLASTGRALLSVIDAVEQEWVERLRADPQMNSAGDTSRAQLADQTAEMIAAFSKALFILEEGGGDPSLLRDAEVVRNVVARHHGEQRRRLGWSREQLEREYWILGQVLDEALRREAPRRTAANLGTALSVVQRLIGRSLGVSLASFDGAHAPGPERGDGPGSDG